MKCVRWEGLVILGANTAYMESMLLVFVVYRICSERTIS